MHRSVLVVLALLLMGTSAPVIDPCPPSEVPQTLGSADRERPPAPTVGAIAISTDPTAIATVHVAADIALTSDATAITISFRAHGRTWRYVTAPDRLDRIGDVACPEPLRLRVGDNVLVSIAARDDAGNESALVARVVEVDSSAQLPRPGEQVGSDAEPCSHALEVTVVIAGAGVLILLAAAGAVLLAVRWRRERAPVRPASATAISLLALEPLARVCRLRAGLFTVGSASAGVAVLGTSVAFLVAWLAVFTAIGAHAYLRAQRILSFIESGEATAERWGNLAVVRRGDAIAMLWASPQAFAQVERRAVPAANVR